jgi:hypothetical protein
MGLHLTTDIPKILISATELILQAGSPFGFHWQDGLLKSQPTHKSVLANNP